MLLLAPAAGAQSLAEAARREAERRRALEAGGVSGSVVSHENVEAAGRHGAVTTSSIPNRSSRRGESRQSPGGAGARGFRSTLQNLDRQIRDTADRLKIARARIDSERWAQPKPGRQGAAGVSSSVERYRWQVQELEAKLSRLHQERRETWEAGRKAGFLPGELDGRGVTP